ncbi:flagellar FliL protein [Fontimonas thermophila]|uniref:Flagellar protein FliL n=1 Tax=Fontimonas thermophila TaxID=1076937 RepID=A0A1I2IQ73_9GAMM|nr:flagellar basal body-associated FliL family protein [Fontimonas thermophila]SFF43793.1 flagellar FliL protein [Fontimonas thermophila]
MAAAANAADDEKAIVPPDAPPKKGGGGAVGVLLASVLVSAGASGGVAYAVARHVLATASPAHALAEPAPENKAPDKPAQYFALDPAFVVNIEDAYTQRFLQVQVEVMSRDPKTIEAVQHHAPRIRSSLLLLFGQQQAADLATRAGKEKLQAEVLAEIRNILRAETGSDAVEAVYFTSFVMQ